MKKIAVSLFVAMLGCFVCMARETVKEKSSIDPTPMSVEQVCQFSLTSYSGTIYNGATSSFRVGLSCPQQNDVRATVDVYINGERVASKVVTVKASNEYSEKVYINVGNSYNGLKYKLSVM